MKNIFRNIISAAAIATFAALPLAASAYSIGVTDDFSSTLQTGHPTVTGNETVKTTTYSTAGSGTYKIGSSNDTGSAAGQSLDPAQSNVSITGNFSEGANTTANAVAITTDTVHKHSVLDESNGSTIANTSLEQGVGTYFNP